MAKHTIAIIEDDVATRKAVKAMLASCSFGVELYSSAEEYLAGWQNSTASCLVIDVQLRDLSGVELARHLHTLGCQTPKVFMSALRDQTVRQQAEELGIAVVEKPFSAQQLIGSIVKVMESSPER